MVKYLDKILEFLKVAAPYAAVFGAFLNDFYKNKIRRLEKEKHKEETEKEYLENEIKVRKDNDDKSDHDIVVDAIKSGSNEPKD